MNRTQLIDMEVSRINNLNNEERQKEIVELKTDITDELEEIKKYPKNTAMLFTLESEIELNTAIIKKLELK